MASPVADVQAALPGYEVLGELGRGAMGEVLEARHVRLDRHVAIKRLPDAFARDPQVRARFGEEARLLASLNHPHIVPVYDYVEQDDLYLLVMEALPKGTVWDRFTTEGFTLPTACAVVLTACAGINYAHEHRVLHRDVKPDNLMFDAEDSLRVTDFGIAEVLGGDETLATVDGEVIGTPAYMAPEQAAGQPVGPGADVYALATMLYELTSGRLPFDESEGPTGILKARLSEEPVPLDVVAPNVPPSLVRVTMEGLARDPADRPESAQAFGVAVGTAATEAWGSEWMSRSGVRLRSAGPIARSTQRVTQKDHPSPGAEPSADTVAPSADAPAARGTRVSGSQGTPDIKARGTRISGEPATPQITPQVRPTVTPGGEEVAVRPELEEVRAGDDRVHHGGQLRDIEPADFVPVHEVLRPPPVPRLAIAVTALAALLLVVVGLVGIGTPGRDDGLSDGQVFVNDQDVAGGGPVTANLAEQVSIEIDDLPEEARQAEAVELRLSAAGVPLGTSTAGELPPDGRGVTDVGARSLRVITGGEVTADLRFLDDDGDAVHQHEFPLDIDQPWYLTAAALGGLVVLVLLVAYATSVATPLWLGRHRRSAGIALTWLGGLAGLVVLLLTWSIGGNEPTIVTVAVVVVLGAVVGGVGAWALFRLRRRHRLLVGGPPAGADDAVVDVTDSDPDDDGRTSVPAETTS